jgi:putative inorganic carbon (HCO3(-)) transporter
MAGLVLTLLYVALLILRLEDLAPGLDAYSPMLVLGIFASVASLPNIQQARPFEWRESKLLLLFFAVMIVSDLMGLWLGGAWLALKLFSPCLFVYFLIVSNVTTPARMRALLLVCVGAGLIAAVEAIAAYHFGFRSDELLFVQNLYGQQGFAGDTVNRIQFLGWLNDPNDFGQFQLICIPLTAMLAVAGRRLANLLLLLPASVFAYGVFLTRSRGALIGIAIVVLFAFRKRIGRIGSAAAAVLGVVGLFAVGFTGGRGLTIGDGSDRLELWSDGFDVFRLHPLFGVGYNRWGDFAGPTAHNSYLLCMTEVGIVGFTVWIGVIALTLMNLRNQINAVDAAPEGISLTDHATGRRQAEWCTLALLAFLATAFFLSRTYAPLLYLLLAIAVALGHIYMPEPEQAMERPAPRWMRAALVSEGALMLLIYVFIRAFHSV